MRIVEYEFNNILNLPRINELFKMKCWRADVNGWLKDADCFSEPQTFINLRNTPETQFDDLFFIEVENLQREYRTFDENDEIIEYDIGEILTGDYTNLRIEEIEWITRQSKELGFKRIYEWNKAVAFEEKPPY